MTARDERQGSISNPPSPVSPLISTTGISGNASVTNIAGDSITHIYNDSKFTILGALTSIEERLKIVHDREMGL